jgi:hypothetical protein
MLNAQKWGKKPLDVFFPQHQGLATFNQKNHFTLQQKQHKTSTITIT